MQTTRETKLNAWLARVQARNMWSASIDRDHNITAYLINNRLCLVLRNSRSNGWDLFVQASSSINITDTLDAAAVNLGVEGCRDLPD